MYKFTIILLLVLSSVLINAQGWMWTKHFNGTGQNQPTVIAQDNAGNYYVYGNFNGTITQDEITLNSYGIQDIFLAKYNSLGVIQWMKKIGGTGTETAIGLVLSHDGNYLYVSGQTNGLCDFDGFSFSTTGVNDIFLAKYDLNGTRLWAHNTAYGTTQQINGAIAVDNNEDIIMTGVFIDNVTFYGGTASLTSLYSGVRQIFAVKFDQNGDHIWSKVIHCDDATTSTNIKAVSTFNNEYYFSGQYIGNVDIDGNIISNATGLSDGIIFKLNNSGNFQWVKKMIGADNAEYIYKHVNDESGNLYVSGYYLSSQLNIDGAILNNSTSGKSDIVISKYNTSGTLQWAKNIGSTGDDRVLSIHASNNKIVITGSYGGTIYFGNDTLLNSGSTDAFIAECDASGNFIKAVKATGTGNDLGEACFYSKTGRNFIATGDFYSPALSIGPDLFTNSVQNLTTRDAYITRYGCFDSLSFVVTPVNCVDGMGMPIVEDGAITVTPSEGNEPYTYNWSNSASTQTISNLGLGTFTVTVTGTNGCTLVGSAVVGNKPILQASITNIVNVTCAGQNSGSATVTATLGIPPYQYLWSNAATSPSIANVAAETYNVTVTDQCGNTVFCTAIITQPTVLTATISAQTNVSCNGGSNGSATAVADGGIAPYTYLWNDPAPAQTTATCTSLPAEIWSVTITDANNCTGTTAVTITQPVALTATISAQTNVSCNGGSNGSATVTAGGGTAPYTYLWNDPAPAQTTATCSALTVGIWTVTITDNNSCTTTSSVTITQPTTVTAAIIAQTNVSCYGGSNGSATVQATGGSNPITYVWNDPAPVQTTQTATGLTAGTWSVTVTKTGGCAITSVTITQPTLLTASITAQTNVSCNGGANGSATVTASGGTPGYSYNWAPNGYTGDGTPTYSNLVAGNYRVTVTAVGGCTVIAYVTITQPAALTGTITQTNVSCNGGSDGSATVTAGGGTPPYTYLWNDPAPAQTTPTCTTLTAGTWRVTVTDDNGCTIRRTVIITQPSALTSSIIAKSNVSCNNGSNGSATVGPVGGTTPYTYLWNDPIPAQTTATCSALTAGIWTVTVTDSHSCTSTSNVTITQPTTVTAAIIAQTNISCNGGSDGSATVQATGGSNPTTYVWNDPAPVQTTQTASGLTAGSWSVTVTRTGGCAVASVTITQPTTVTAAIIAQTNISCNGGSEGSATVQATGGSNPTTYIWNDPAPVQTTQTATGLTAGTWSVTVTNTGGCAVASVIITQPAILTATITAQTNVSCNGGSNGSATVTAGGGTTPYSYLWNDPAPAQTTATCTSLTAGTWTVTVTDANSCSRTSNVTITQPTVLTSSIIAQTNVSCNGGTNGSATVGPVGGTTPYTYLWNDPVPAQTTATCSALIAGVWTVTVTDNNSCTSTSSVTITQPTVVTASIIAQTNVSCNGGFNGTATVQATGGSNPTTYVWNDPAPVQTTQTATGLTAGTWSVTVTRTGGCAIASATITQPDVIAITRSTTCSYALPNCTGTATASVTGGTIPYSYLWNDPNSQTTQTAIDLCPGRFTVTVTDANGCTRSLGRFRVTTCPKSQEAEETTPFSNINKIAVYPNPASSYLSILIDNDDKPEKSTVILIEIYNLLGELISMEKNKFLMVFLYLKMFLIIRRDYI